MKPIIFLKLGFLVLSLWSQQVLQASEELFRAIRENDINALRSLSNQGADINLKNDRGIPLLHMTARKEMIEELVKLGANIDVRGRNGNTALHEAVDRGDYSYEAVETLIKLGADINAKNWRGNTPLHEASRTFSLGIGTYPSTVRLLLSEGADINARNKRGETSLHLAARRGLRNIAKILLSRGADPISVDMDGNSILHKAAQSGDMEIYNEPIMSWALKRGIDIDVRNNSGETPLFAAVMARQPAAIVLLASNGAEITATDNNGENPLERLFKIENEFIRNNDWELTLIVLSIQIMAANIQAGNALTNNISLEVQRRFADALNEYLETQYLHWHDVELEWTPEMKEALEKFLSSPNIGGHYCQQMYGLCDLPSSDFDNIACFNLTFAPRKSNGLSSFWEDVKRFIPNILRNDPFEKGIKDSIKHSCSVRGKTICTWSGNAIQCGNGITYYIVEGIVNNDNRDESGKESPISHQADNVQPEQTFTR